jgi:class 3 adenylate cyclase/tetratricopeptide (TPR) repeat protein
MNCLLCHASVPDRAENCPFCGGALGWVCEACQQTNSSPFVRCRRCGGRRRGTQASADGDGPAQSERKLVTVLFADIRGSMSLISGRDPEQADEMLDAVIAQMTQAVHSFEGTVSRIMGDGIMALFGAPQATEHHAVKACLAALWMRDAVARNAPVLPGLDPVALRIGLASGEVVVKPIAASNFAGYEANGEVVHLAARMEQTAGSNRILLTPHTQRLVARHFETRPMGPVEIKGLTEPMDVWELGVHRPGRGRWRAVPERAPTPLLERDAELVAIRRARADAMAGNGRLVRITGDAGNGKSRLVAEALHEDPGDLLILQGQAQPFGAKGFRVVSEILGDFLGLEPRDDVSIALAKLGERLGAYGQEDLFDALAAILDLGQRSADWMALAPAMRRERMHQALWQLLAAVCARQPVAVIAEDVHWMDPESAAVLTGLARRLPGMRLLLVATARPDMQADWGAGPHHVHIMLDGLSDQTTRSLIGRWLTGGPGVEALTQTLIARSGGNPLFLEEMVSGLVDAGTLLRIGNRYALTRTVAPDTLPETIRGILAERVDRLSPSEKDVLEAAAVVGFRAPAALIALVRGNQADDQAPDGVAPEEAVPALLLDGGFLDASPRPDATLTFRHALMREVVYAGILRRRRTEMHGRVVNAMERLYAGRISEHVEELADHAARAGLWAQAAAYGERAAAKAAARDANAEAVGFYEQALTWLAHLPDTAERRLTTIDLHLAIRDPLFRLGRIQDIANHLDVAEPLAQAAADPSRLGLLYVLRSHAQTLSGESGSALENGALALNVARAGADHALEARASFQVGLEHFNRGEFTDALTAFATLRAYRLRAPDDTRYGLARAMDTAALAYMARAHAERGEMDAALEELAEAERMAAVLNGAFDWQFVCFAAGNVHSLRGAHKEAMHWLERARDYCLQGNMPLMAAFATVSLGGAQVRAGATDQGLTDLRRGIAEMEAMKVGVQMAHALIVLGDALLIAGDVAGAAEVAERALHIARQNTQRASEVRALLLLGLCGQRGTENVVPARARDCLTDGLALADGLGMALVAERCRTALAELETRTPCMMSPPGA